MRSWIRKLFSAHPRGRSAEADELGLALERMDERLRDERPERTVPAGLHAAIVRRVERANRAAPKRARVGWHWMAAPAAAGVMVLAVWMAARPGTSEAPKTGTAVAASELSLDISPDSLKAKTLGLEQMDREAKLLKRDCEQALRIALASFPGEATSWADNGHGSEKR